MRSILHQQKRKPKAMNFDEYASEGNRIINEVAKELNTDRNSAARITRAVLHAVRDRLPADDAVEFAQGLPMALKGVFLDQYDISATPVVIRSRKKFIEFVRSKAGAAAEVIFPDHISVAQGLQAVFYVLEKNMSYGQVEQIKRMLNIEIVDLIEGY
jgi:uncharacterized protein (DUF2267 family)